MLNKEKLGKNIYYISFISAIVILVLAWLLFDVKGLEGEELIKILKYRYILLFVSLEAIVPIGALVREYCLGKFNKKIWTIKLVLVIAVFAIGLLLLLLTNSVSLFKSIILVSVLLLIYSATPSINEKQNE